MISTLLLIEYGGLYTIMILCLSYFLIEPIIIFIRLLSFLLQISLFFFFFNSLVLRKFFKDQSFLAFVGLYYYYLFIQRRNIVSREELELKKEKEKQVSSLRIKKKKQRRNATYYWKRILNQSPFEEDEDKSLKWHECLNVGQEK